jgi:undecaprenyl-diphosphatase
MTIVQSIILAIVEGFTEFLPISSTGHLILVSNFLKIPQNDFTKSFEIIIQLGAILAVVMIYFNYLVKHVKYWKQIIISFLPTAVLGFTLYKFIKHFLIGNTYITLLSLFIGGILIIIFEKYFKSRSGFISIEKLTKKNAFLIGLFQSLSMIPGVSRAAATIFGGMYMKLDRKNAVEFSFLLAIPTMTAATGFDLLKSGLNFTSYEYLLLIIGFTGSFIMAIISIKFLLKFIQNHTFTIFGVYRIILAFVYLIYFR